MAYPGNSGYYPAEPNSGHGGYSQWSPESDRGDSESPKVSHRQLTLAVVVLGLCSYLVSFGPMLGGFGIDWDVRFAVLAALLGTFGLLPRQTPAAAIVATLAAIGFLDALSRVVVLPEGVQPGWAMWVVVVLNAVQAGLAVAALLAQPSASEEQQAWYAAYAEQYAQAAAQYYGEYDQGDQPESGYDSGLAQARQLEQVSAAEPGRSAAPQPAPQQASYSEFVAEPAPATGAPLAAPSAQQSAGLPNIGHSAAPAEQTSADQQVIPPEEHRSTAQ